MANLDIPENPQFTKEVLKLDPTVFEHSHANSFNGIHKKLLDNNVYLENIKADKSIRKEATLAAAGWQGATAPYNYALELTEATETNLIEIVPQLNPTLEQYETWAEAGIAGGKQSVGNITLLAYGDKPEIDLPIIILVRGD